MLKVESALKELYRSDSTDKNLIIEFTHPGKDKPFLQLWESRHIMGESMEIDEALSSSDNIDFGSCEAAQIKITLIDVEENIKGAEMTVYQTLNGLYPSDRRYPGSRVYPSGYTMPLGRYTVQSAEKQANRKYRDIVALDYMCRFDVSVIDWYNALPFPLTLRDFRARLCQYIGVRENVPSYLPNDNMLVEKTIEAAELMGRDVLTACEQINGVFGHFDRTCVLQHITLQPNYTLMPSPSLYPSGSLYPVLPGTMNRQVYDERISRNLYMSCQFEEYTVKSLDKVQIRQEEGDIGAIYGTGENCLMVEGNFLVFGKSSGELNGIARGIYGMVSNRQYIPYECSLKGLPYIEVGDTELIETEQGSLVTYAMKRTLKGIFALKDTHSATGEEIRSTEHNINTDIIQLKGKAAILKRSVDEVSANLVDLEKNTEAKFAITAEQILAEVKRAQDAEASLKLMADSITLSVKDLKENTESQFLQTAKQMLLKVSIGDVSSQLSIEPDDITIQSNRFSWEATNSSMTKDGTLNCKNIRAENGYFSGVLRTDIFDASDNEVMIGDWIVSSDATNVFRSGDESVIFQTAAGGPFGSYSTLSLSSRSGTTTLSDHHLDVNQIQTNGIKVRDDIYFADSWTEGMSLLEMLRDLYNRVG